MEEGGGGFDFNKVDELFLSNVAQVARGAESITQDELSTNTMPHGGGGVDNSTTDERPSTTAQASSIVIFNKDHLLAAIQENSLQPDFGGMQRYGFRYDVSAEINNFCIDHTMNSFLNDSSIINWAPETCYLSAIHSAGHGNCLLNSCSLFMWGVNDHEYALRMKLFRTFRTNNELGNRLREYFKLYTTLSGMMYMNDEDIERDWQQETDIGESSLRSIRKDLTEFHCFAIANVLRRPIIVYGLPGLEDTTMEGVYLPLLVDSALCERSPLLIGFAHGHYVPLFRYDTMIDLSDGSASQLKTLAVTGEFSDYVPIFNRAYETFKVYYLYYNEDCQQTLQNYLDIIISGTHFFVTLKDQNLPDGLRGTRPEYISELLTPSILPQLYNVKTRKAEEAVQKPVNTFSLDSNITSKTMKLIAKIEESMKCPDLDLIKKYGYRFDTRNKTNLLLIDETYFTYLTKKKTINWHMSTCWLLPVKCAGERHGMTNAISLFMWGINDHNSTLRKKLHATLTEQSELKQKLRRCFQMRDSSPPTASDEERDKRWKDVAEVWSSVNMDIAMKKLGRFHLFALANALRRPIIVYSAPRTNITRETLAGVYLPLCVDSEHCSKSPVLLAEVRQRLLALMRADIPIGSARDVSSNDEMWLSKACGDNGLALEDEYSVYVPLTSHEREYLPVPFLERDANQFQFIKTYLRMGQNGFDHCAELHDLNIPDEYRENCPEKPTNFSNPLPQEKRCK